MDQISATDIRLQNRTLMRELRAAFERVLLEDEPILGSAVGDFERAFARWLGTNHAVGVGNGTDALLLALRALDIGAGDEVLVPANAYPAAVLAVLQAGGRPVLVEPNLDDHCIDPRAAAEALSTRSRAIVAVHSFGLPADMEAIAALAADADLRVIEDAAEAYGAELGGRKAGTLGDLGCFSFHPRKILGAIGDAGAVATASGDLADRLRALRDFGRGASGEWEERAWNTRLDTLQAAFLRVKLARADESIFRRRRHAERYQEAFADLPIQRPVDTETRCHAWCRYVIGVEAARRDELLAALRERGVHAMNPYPVLAHRQSAFAALGWRAGQCPISEGLWAASLALPLYAEMTDAQGERVIEVVRGALRE